MTTRAHRIKELSPQWQALLNSADLTRMKEANARKFDVVKHSTRAWLIYQDEVPVYFFGVMKGTFLGHGAEFWFMPCASMPLKFRRTIPFARRGLERIIKLYGSAKCVVDMEFAKGQRFVEHFDFQKVGTMVTEDGHEHYVYEKRASWQ